MQLSDFIKIAIEAGITMAIVNGFAFYLSRRGMATKILLITSPTIAAGFLLGMMFMQFGFTPVTAGIFFVASLGVSMAFIWAIFKWMVLPVNKIAGIAGKISEGNLDVGEDTSTFGHDELGQMMRAVSAMVDYLKKIENVASAIANGDLCAQITISSDNDKLGESLQQMINTLQTLIGNLQKEAAQVAYASSNVCELAENSRQTTSDVSEHMAQLTEQLQAQAHTLDTTASAIDQMLTAIHEIANGAQTQFEAVNQAATIASEINSAITQVAKNTRASAAGAAQAAKAAHNGAQTVEETVEGMGRIKDTVGVSAQKVQEMGVQSGKIGDIIETIDEIAAQTNLLALNAAIEAARAGEHGKGFAVVADEVRKLAEKSAQATQEISGLLSGIQQVVTEAVTAMEEGTNEVDAGMRHAAKSQSALSNIIASADGVNHQVDEIATAAQHIGASSTNLMEAVNVMRDVIESNTAATEEMAGQSTEVKEVLAHATTVSSTSRTMVANVAEISQTMREKVESGSESAQSLETMAASMEAMAAKFKLNGVTH